jgi:hypothetical protein
VGFAPTGGKSGFFFFLKNESSGARDSHLLVRLATSRFGGGALRGLLSNLSSPLFGLRQGAIVCALQESEVQENKKNESFGARDSHLVVRLATSGFGGGALRGLLSNLSSPLFGLRQGAIVCVCLCTQCVCVHSACACVCVHSVHSVHNVHCVHSGHALVQVVGRSYKSSPRFSKKKIVFKFCSMS